VGVHLRLASPRRRIGAAVECPVVGEARLGLGELPQGAQDVVLGAEHGRDLARGQAVAVTGGALGAEPAEHPEAEHLVEQRLEGGARGCFCRFGPEAQAFLQQPLGVVAGTEHALLIADGV
jgi:hypothetical protein